IRPMHQTTRPPGDVDGTGRPLFLPITQKKQIARPGDLPQLSLFTISEVGSKRAFHYVLRPATKALPPSLRFFRWKGGRIGSKIGGDLRRRGAWPSAIKRTEDCGHRTGLLTHVR